MSVLAGAVTLVAADPGTEGMAEARSTASATEFAEIFERHHDSAYRLACLLCGDRSVAEDVTAEAFARTFERWDRGGVRDVRAYLRTAVVNQARGTFRRRARHRRDTAWAEERAPAPATFDDRLADRALVHELLLALPLRQRAAIVLRYYEDLSEADTAAALGTRVGTVKAQVSRGLDRLREMLEEQPAESS